MVKNEILSIIEKESKEVLAGVLIDLIQLDKKNEERFLILYSKR